MATPTMRGGVKRVAGSAVAILMMLRRELKKVEDEEERKRGRRGGNGEVEKGGDIDDENDDDEDGDDNNNDDDGNEARIEGRRVSSAEHDLVVVRTGGETVISVTSSSRRRQNLQPPLQQQQGGSGKGAMSANALADFAKNHKRPSQEGGMTPIDNNNNNNNNNHPHLLPPNTITVETAGVAAAPLPRKSISSVAGYDDGDDSTLQSNDVDNVGGDENPLSFTSIRRAGLCGIACLVESLRNVTLNTMTDSNNINNNSYTAAARAQAIAMNKAAMRSFLNAGGGEALLLLAYHPFEDVDERDVIQNNEPEDTENDADDTIEEKERGKSPSPSSFRKDRGGGSPNSFGGNSTSNSTSNNNNRSTRSINNVGQTSMKDMIGNSIMDETTTTNRSHSQKSLKASAISSGSTMQLSSASSSNLHRLQSLKSIGGGAATATVGSGGGVGGTRSSSPLAGGARASSPLVSHSMILPSPRGSDASFSVGVGLGTSNGGNGLRIGIGGGGGSSYAFGEQQQSQRITGKSSIVSSSVGTRSTSLFDAMKSRQSRSKSVDSGYNKLNFINANMAYQERMQALKRLRGEGGG